MPEPTYAEFLSRKQAKAASVGTDVDLAEIHPSMHPWQGRAMESCHG